MQPEGLCAIGGVKPDDPWKRIQKRGSGKEVTPYFVSFSKGLISGSVLHLAVANGGFGDVWSTENNEEEYYEADFGTFQERNL